MNQGNLGGGGEAYHTRGHGRGDDAFVAQRRQHLRGRRAHHLQQPPAASVRVLFGHRRRARRVCVCVCVCVLRVCEALRTTCLRRAMQCTKPLLTNCCST
jgi:hypothetical protein